MLDSPFLGGQAVTIIDLERAVQACRLTYPKVVKARINMWSLRWRMGGRSFPREVEKFFVYVKDYFSAPQFIPPVQRNIMFLQPAARRRKILSSLVQS